MFTYVQLMENAIDIKCTDMFQSQTVSGSGIWGVGDNIL